MARYTYTGGPVRHPYAIADYNPQSETKNLATGSPNLHILYSSGAHAPNLFYQLSRREGQNDCTVFLYFPHVVVNIFIYSAAVKFFCSQLHFLLFLVSCRSSSLLIFRKKTKLDPPSQRNASTNQYCPDFVLFTSISTDIITPLFCYQHRLNLASKSNSFNYDLKMFIILVLQKRLYGNVIKH
jgi:hypothetical protein